MPLKETITEHMKDAMRHKETLRLGTIRMLLSEIKKKEIDTRQELDDSGVVAVVEKMIKQRKDSVEQYEKANRQDLADNEKAEIEVLTAYMPQQLSEAEVDALIAETIQETGAQGAAGMGKVMGVLKAKLAGRADFSQVSAKVRALLNG